MKIFMYEINSWTDFWHLFNSDQTFSSLVFLFLITVWPLIWFIISKIIDKTLSDKIKMNIIKILISIVMILAVIVIIKWVLYGENATRLFVFMLMVISIPEVVYQCTINIKDPKPDKYLLEEKTYDEFSNNLKTKLLANGYEEYMQGEEYKVYKKGTKYILDIYTEDLKSEDFDKKYDTIVNKLSNRQILKIREGTLLVLLSVNKLPSNFNNYLLEMTIDERMPSVAAIGISFGGKKIYFPNEYEGFEDLYAKRNKKEIKEILNLKNKIK